MLVIIVQICNTNQNISLLILCSNLQAEDVFLATSTLTIFERIIIMKQEMIAIAIELRLHVMAESTYQTALVTSHTVKL